MSYDLNKLLEDQEEDDENMRRAKEALNEATRKERQANRQSDTENIGSNNISQCVKWKDQVETLSPDGTLESFPSLIYSDSSLESDLPAIESSLYSITE
mmetsp:Transcript_2961/g.3335  ORF Transcript_2961/g.3335 Transcript_2961/m.3335 type:complete len:99 (-) Transcript_2961:112-408(-)